MLMRNNNYNISANFDNSMPVTQCFNMIVYMFKAVAAINGILAVIVKWQSSAIITGVIAINTNRIGHNRLPLSSMTSEPDIKYR